jgi:RNA polymerase sigma-70 factor (ECF subfamily)
MTVALRDFLQPLPAGIGLLGGGPTPPAAAGGALEPSVSDVTLAAAGDRRAFERLYRAHVDRVYSLCARMTADRGQAEELTQDVFVRAWEKLALFRGESAFSTWLHRLAVNLVLNRRDADGRQRRRTADDPDGDLVAAHPARPVTPADRMDLERAIAALPPGARRVFVLHDVEGYRHEEIAERLGITAGGSKAQLHRARLLLRQSLVR